MNRTLFGAVVRNLLSTRDLERANAELREARLNLIRQDKLASLGVLSAGIAHEINNPLALIKSGASVLERNHAELAGPPVVLAEDAELFAEIHEAFRRIGDVVGSLASFSRDLPEGDKAPYDLSRGLEATLALARHETAGVLTLRADLPDLPPVQARGSEINQVLLNLLLNAFQAVGHLPEGQERVVAVRTWFDPTSVWAEVANNGPPIPPDHRERIFEPFFSTKAPGQGMGLGLSLGWQIVVQRHGGDLELASADPVVFRLRLPR